MLVVSIIELKKLACSINDILWRIFKCSKTYVCRVSVIIDKPAEGYIQGRIQDLAMGGAKICREASYIYERSELRAKRV